MNAKIPICSRCNEEAQETTGRHLDLLQVNAV